MIVGANPTRTMSNRRDGESLTAEFRPVGQTRP